ncbi:MAG: hypothetical protein ACFNX0_01510, partial [Treponema sp.]
MPLNKNTKELLETPMAENDYLSYSVKRCITNCLNDDTKAANADFVTEMKKKRYRGLVAVSLALTACQKDFLETKPSE